MDKTYFLRSNLFPYQQDNRINPNYLTNFIYRQGELQGPLDLSLRGPVPITPPSTPSPPRKRLINSENKNFDLDKKQFQYLIENDDCVLLSNSESIKEKNPKIENAEFIDITSQDDNENENETDEKLSENCSNSGYDSDDKAENIEDLEQHGILKEGKGYFENLTYHSQAIEGFAKLFEKSFTKNYEDEENDLLDEDDKKDLNKIVVSEKISKIDRKKFKSRKQVAEEDNTSPVSGTIIRKLRDDEELVVRKVKF